jgi:hypothetical protein
VPPADLGRLQLVVVDREAAPGPAIGIEEGDVDGIGGPGDDKAPDRRCASMADSPGADGEERGRRRGQLGLERADEIDAPVSAAANRG